MEPSATGIAAIAAAGLIGAVAFLQRRDARLRALSLAALAAAALAVLAQTREEGVAAAALLALALCAAGIFAGLARNAFDASPLSIPRRERHVMLALGRLEPRLFRSLMRLGELRSAEIPLRLATQGRSPEHLWFLVDGEIRLEKDGETAHLRGPMFVGEIAWVTRAPSAATAVVLPGAEFLEWDRRALRHAGRRDPRLRLALEALVARDLARKLAAGRPPLDAADERAGAGTRGAL